MKYLGNYCDWINDEWIDIINSQPGKRVPQEQDIDKNDYIFDVNNSFNHVYYEQYDSEYSDNIKLTPSWPMYSNFEWWIVKQTTGMLIPMHQDEFESGRIHKRYWMPFQDYTPGHIFLYEDKLITDYKKGDLFEFDDNLAVHYSGNASYSTRIVLQISAWEYV